MHERKAELGVGDSALASDKPAKKRKGKKERMRAKAVVDQDGPAEGDVEDGTVAHEESGPIQKKRKADDDASGSHQGADNGTEQSKAKRRRHKKSNKPAVDT